MVKRYVLFMAVVMVLLSFGRCRAQSFSEWFKQKKTQKKYLLAQIAGLQAYSEAVEKGYAIASEGLSAITALKEGDFLQHAVYFSNQGLVSSRLKNYAKVTAMADLEDRAAQLRRFMMEAKGLDTLLNSQELTGLRQINKAASAEAGKDLEELALLVTDGKLKMSTGERISHIDALYVEVKKKCSDTLILARNLQLLISSRKKQLKYTQALKALYGP